MNRKAAELIINLPRTLVSLEPQIRAGILEVFSRGRITVQVAVEQVGGARSTLQVDDHLATEYYQAFQLLQQIWHGTASPFQAADLLRAPGVFTVKEDSVTLQDVEPLLEDALSDAFTRLLDMQNMEGARLRADLRDRLEALRAKAEHIAGQAPRVKERYRQQLHRRLQDSGVNFHLDDERLLRESPCLPNAAISARN